MAACARPSLPLICLAANIASRALSEGIDQLMHKELREMQLAAASKWVVCPMAVSQAHDAPVRLLITRLPPCFTVSASPV